MTRTAESRILRPVVDRRLSLFFFFLFLDGRSTRESIEADMKECWFLLTRVQNGVAWIGGVDGQHISHPRYDRRR